MITLLLKQDRSITFTLTKEVSIVGRTSSKCDVAIKHKDISRVHLSITQKDGTVKIVDLGSKNHTYVPEKDLLENGSGATVKHGDIIKIGSIEFIIQIDGKPLPEDEIELADEEDP